MGLSKLWPGFFDHLSDYLSHMTNLPVPHQGTKGECNSKILGRVVNSSHRFVSF